jgi:actin related protein 2/3 complex subunit 3
MEPFALPGDAGWPLGGLFTPPANREEAGACGARSSGARPDASPADALRAYLKQAREETGARLVLKCYTEDDKPNKFWMAFSKRKFMNKEL